jgi:hypothetical protein
MTPPVSMPGRFLLGGTEVLKDSITALCIDVDVRDLEHQHQLSIDVEENGSV